MAEKWMQEAFAHNQGALTRQAKKAHMGTMEFANKKYHASGVTGQRARAAVNAQQARNKGQKKALASA